MSEPRAASAAEREYALRKATGTVRPAEKPPKPRPIRMTGRQRSMIARANAAVTYVCNNGLRIRNSFKLPGDSLFQQTPLSRRRNPHRGKWEQRHPGPAHRNYRDRRNHASK